MVIQHNIPAMNAHRNLGINNSAVAKNLEKLSSGYRINRAADDAAGLAISEKMRGQIRGLGMAEQNAKNGISLIQTAEGALSESHSILQRMRELAVQSSNGTYQDEDRMMITKEFNELKGELDRIAESTHYNGIKLLDGSLSGAATGSNAVAPNVAKLLDTFDPTALKIAKGAWTAPTSTTYKVDTGRMNELVAEMEKNGMDKTKITTAAQFQTALADFFGVDEADYTWTVTGGTFAAGGMTANPTALEFTTSVPGANDPNTDKILLAKGGVTKGLAYVSTQGKDAYNKIDFIVGTNGTDIPLIGNSFEVNGKTYTFVGDLDTTKDDTTKVAKSGDKLGDNEYAVYIGALQAGTSADVATQIAAAIKNAESTDTVWDAATGKVTTDGTTSTAAVASGSKVTIDQMALTQPKGAKAAATGSGLVFQIGANGSDDQRVSMSVNNMSSKALGESGMDVEFNSVTGMSVADASIATITDANKAIDILDGATNMVSAQRASLGALQNRLESALNTLGIAKENLTSAESVIRDVDMAKEMMEFTKNNILVQAAQAMLAQANSLPQGVLQLLR